MNSFSLGHRKWKFGGLLQALISLGLAVTNLSAQDLNWTSYSFDDMLNMTQCYNKPGLGRCFSSNMDENDIINFDDMMKLTQSYNKPAGGSASVLLNFDLNNRKFDITESVQPTSTANTQPCGAGTSPVLTSTSTAPTCAVPGELSRGQMDLWARYKVMGTPGFTGTDNLLESVHINGTFEYTKTPYQGHMTVLGRVFDGSSGFQAFQSSRTHYDFDTSTVNAVANAGLYPIQQTSQLIENRYGLFGLYRQMYVNNPLYPTDPNASNFVPNFIRDINKNGSLVENYWTLTSGGSGTGALLNKRCYIPNTFTPNPLSSACPVGRDPVNPTGMQELQAPEAVYYFWTATRDVTCDNTDYANIRVTQTPTRCQVDITFKCERAYAGASPKVEAGGSGSYMIENSDTQFIQSQCGPWSQLSGSRTQNEL